ncbi:MAG: hypothetical protein ACJ8FS_07520 [Sphingomicrobium sp.]
MKSLRISLLAAAALLPSAALAQQPTPDRAATAGPAEQALAQAEQAVAQAEQALKLARQALAAAEGRPISPSQSIATASALPPDENVPVFNETMAAEAEQRAFAAGIGASAANGPNVSALKSTPVPDFQLLASTKDKVGTISWSMDVSGQPKPGTLSSDQLTLTASAKLDDAGNGSILGLDGLGNGSEAKLSFTHYVSALHLSGREMSEVARARSNCLAQPGGTEKECNPYDYATGVSAFIAKYNPNGLRPLLSAVLPGPVYFFGLDISGNQASFKYLDRSAFAIKKVSHFGFGGGAYAGLLLGAGHTAIIGSFDYKRSWDAADDVSLCQAITGTTLTQCLTGADGVPTRSKRGLLGLELRHAFPAPVGSFASFAISPKFTVDVTSGEYSLAAPMYLVSDGDGKLRGGVQGTYTNKKNKDGKRKGDFALGLFIGVPFTLFP